VTQLRRTLSASDEEFGHVVSRARADYLEMPGLKLTSAQAARLWTLDSDTCEAVLTTLVAERFLVRTPNASFVRIHSE
jgi:hypothetical protein